MGDAAITDPAQPFNCQVVCQVQTALGCGTTLTSADLVGFVHITADDWSGKTLIADGHDGTTNQYIECTASGPVSPTFTIRGPLCLTNQLFRCLVRAAVSATASSGAGTISYGTGDMDYYTFELQRKSDVFMTWDDCQVARFKIEGESNGPSYWEAELKACALPTKAATGITIGSDRPTIGATAVQHQCTYSINSADQAHKSWGIEITNPIEGQHYDQVYPGFNKWTGKREQMLECALAYCDASETVRADLAKNTNRAHILVIADGTSTFTVTANDTTSEEANTPAMTDSVDEMTVKVRALADKTNATNPMVMVWS